MTDEKRAGPVTDVLDDEQRGQQKCFSKPVLGRLLAYGQIIMFYYTQSAVRFLA